MDNNQLPHIEIVSQQAPESVQPHTETTWYTAHRFKLFIVCFLVFAITGLTYVFQRPAIYQSKTTLLTVSPAALDQPGQEASLQHVSIQGSILKGQPLIKATREKLLELTGVEPPPVLSLQQMLYVVPVPETNLIELRAEGEDNTFLPHLINTLTEQYQQYRRQQISKETGETTSALNEQIEALSAKVAKKRDELDRFRSEHSILSVGRDENQVLARLKGLTDSLNKASDEEVNAKSKLQAIRSSIKKGQPVVPSSDRSTLANLEKRAQELRERLSELDRRFTRDYLALQPSLRVIPEQLAKIEKKIGQIKNVGKSIVLTEAEQNYYAARQASKELAQQIEDYKQTATEFTRRFSEHEALTEELSQLELLHREAQERIIQIEVQQREKYPQVRVIEMAYPSDKPIRPDYMRDSAIVLSLSLLLGLATIWLFEFLKGGDKPAQRATASWSRVFTSTQNSPAIEVESASRLGNSRSASLDAPQTPYLTNADIEKLFEVANNQGKVIIAALLSGLTLDELSTLSSEQIDLDKNQLIVLPPHARTIPLSQTFTKLLAASVEVPNTTAEMEALITCAAFDSGLPNPETINTSTLRQTYIIYLVQQGLRFSEFEKITGPIPAQELAQLTIHSPSGESKRVEEINLFYPVGD